MAQIFKPEIREAGGSNVQTYSPPTIDYSNVYSGVFNAVANFRQSGRGDPKPSEGEVKNDVLRPFLEKKARILESELPEEQKYVQSRFVDLEVATKYSSYYDTYKKASEGVSQNLDPDGNALENYYAGLGKWSTETDMGKEAQVRALNESRDEGGNINSKKYNAILETLYQEDLTRNARLKAMQASIDENEKNAKIVFSTSFSADAVDFVRKDIDLFTNTFVAKELLDKIRQGKPLVGTDVSSSLMLADQIALRKSEAKIRLTEWQVKAGIPVNSSDYKLDPLLIEYDNLENALRNGGASVEKALRASNEQVSQIYIANMPAVVRSMYEANKALPPAAAAHISNMLMTVEGNKQILDSYAKNFNVPVFTLGLDIGGEGSTNTIGTIPNRDDVGLTETQRLLPEFNPKLIAEITQLNASQKQVQIDKANTLIKNYKFGKIQSLDQANSVYEEMSASFATLTTRAVGNVETGATPLDQTKIFFGPNSFTLIEDVAKNSPQAGNSLYLQMNKTIQAETLRHRDYIVSLLNGVFDTNPFDITVNDKNRIEIKVNQEALKNDPYIRNLMFKPKGRGIPSTELRDEIKNMSDEQIFEKALGAYSSMTGTTKDIMSSLESLNVLLMASNRLPDNIKNSPDFAGIHIREQVSMFPRYSGASILQSE